MTFSPKPLSPHNKFEFGKSKELLSYTTLFIQSFLSLFLSIFCFLQSFTIYFDYLFILCSCFFFSSHLSVLFLSLSLHLFIHSLSFTNSFSLFFFYLFTITCFLSFSPLHSSFSSFHSTHSFSLYSCFYLFHSLFRLCLFILPFSFFLSVCLATVFTARSFAFSYSTCWDFTLNLHYCT